VTASSARTCLGRALRLLLGSPVGFQTLARDARQLPSARLEGLVNQSHLVGRSAWIQSLREKIAQVAAFPSNVLITGPSGTGKELIARAIHEHSPRKSGPFIPVDCTSLTGELFASHLFGHVKGAFTGADHPRLGCFRVAEAGTILLDEIAELSTEMQSKLLRTIQERAVVPLGSDEAVPINVRIIAATNRDLPSEVAAGRFRLDLYYRLNVVGLETSALRDRPDDIEPLAEHFLDKLSVHHGFPRRRLSSAALMALRCYAWPGNVRELLNVIERAAVFAKKEEIGPELIPRSDTAPAQPRSERPAGAVADGATGEWPNLADKVREHILVTLERAFYNQSAAAQLLNIDRASLARKIRHFGIRLPQPRRGRPTKSR
jgi:DNA-binding NtrC family response regulator